MVARKRGKPGRAVAGLAGKEKSGFAWKAKPRTGAGA
jgi:hypothetical protein